MSIFGLFNSINASNFNLFRLGRDSAATDKLTDRHENDSIKVPFFISEYGTLKSFRVYKSIILTYMLRENSLYFFISLKVHETRIFH